MADYSANLAGSPVENHTAGRIRVTPRDGFSERVKNGAFFISNVKGGCSIPSSRLCPKMLKPFEGAQRIC